MAVVHISEAEAVRDFRGLLARVRDGADVILDDSGTPVRLTAVSVQHGRPLSESIARARAREILNGPYPETDDAFVEDMETIIAGRSPRDTSAWD